MGAATDHSITHNVLGPAELEELLRAFEDAWQERSGERLTSAQFYDRYRAGELDSVLALSWASYYEGFRRLSSEGVDTCLVDALADAG